MLISEQFEHIDHLRHQIATLTAELEKARAAAKPSADVDTIRLTEHSSGFLGPGRRSPAVTYAFHGSDEKSLGIPWPIPSGMKKKALAMGNAWLWDLKAKRAGRMPIEAPASVNRDGWLFEALKEFREAKVERLSRNRQYSYANAFKFYFGESRNQKLDDGWLHRQCLERTRAMEEKWDHNTQALYALCVKSFVQYCQNRGYIHRNPFALIDYPRLRARTEHVIHSEKEIVAVASRLCETWPNSATAEQAMFFWLFIFHTGMRRSEPLGLWWDRHIRHDRIILTKTKTGRNRFFPLTPAFPEVVTIVNELERFREQNKGKLFPWERAQEVVAAAVKIMDEFGIPHTNRPAHDARATCAVRWRKRGIPETMLPDLLGHGFKTYLAYYRNAPEPVDFSG